MARQTQTRSRKNDSGKKNPLPGVGEMAKKEKTKLDTIIKPGAVVRADLPDNLLHELAEITRNSGKEIDLSLPIEELEAICNRANNPPYSWRTRWSE